MENLVKINELEFDSELYPRMKISWQTAYQYAQAMRSGSTFPPIKVGIFNGKKYVVDGWHRVEAKKKLKEEYIQADVKKYDSKRELFIDAIESNVIHGRQLSIQEKVRIIDMLKDMNFKLQEISKIVKVPIGKISIFQARTIRDPSGRKIYMKSAVARANPEKEAVFSLNMDMIGDSRSIDAMLTQLIEFVEKNIYPFDNSKVRSLSERFYNLLGENLEL